MHSSVLDWVGMIVHTLDIENAGKVLEVGSMDINGSVRSFFKGQYIGMDMMPGKGVDVVASGHSIPYPTGYFDVVITTETLEHDDKFWLTLREIGRVLKSEGILVITARGNGFELHRHPRDYYRFMPDAAEVLMGLAGCETIIVEEDSPPGILAVGRKP